MDSFETTEDGIEIRRFGAVDYTVFIISLLLSLFVGVFAGAKDWARAKMERVGTMRDITGLKDQLVGGGDMNPVMVALSLLASFLSAPFLLGTPAEIYVYGTMYLAIFFANLIAGPLTAHLFVPVFHRQQITSAYEFIEKRFNGWIRLLGSILFCLMTMLYMAVIVYAPAAAFSQVTGLPTLASILGVGIICTLYTAFGGMKAVVWTDAIQMVIILIGVIAVIIGGLVELGGPGIVVENVRLGGRVIFDVTSPDPRTRHSWWTQTIGGTFTTLAITGTNQAMIQRYLAIKTTKKAQMSCYYAMFFQEIFLILVSIMGLVMFAYYYRCDPLITGRVQSKDQLVPLFVMDTLGDIYGLPGLFSASVFAASLSTVSSGVNALAAVVISDIVHPVYVKVKERKMSIPASARLSKALSLAFGIVTVALSFVSPFLGATLLQVVLSVIGIIGGPLLGLFSLAIFFPCANEWGAIAGTLGSIAFTAWIAIGAILNPVSPMPLELLATNCSFPTNATQTLPPPRIDDGFNEKDFYQISYMWYSLISLIVAVCIGLPVSLITGGNKDSNDANLYFAYHRKCTPCFNACRCERCFPIDDTEEVIDTKNYNTSMADKRASVDSVFGMYAENPNLGKRTSIAIQLGATGSISGHLTHRPSVWHISRKNSETLDEIGEEEEDDEGVLTEGATVAGNAPPPQPPVEKRKKSVDEKKRRKSVRMSIPNDKSNVYDKKHSIPNGGVDNRAFSTFGLGSMEVAGLEDEPQDVFTGGPVGSRRESMVQGVSIVSTEL